MAVAAIAGLILAMLVIVRNGVKIPEFLATHMSSSLAAAGLQPEDVEVDSISFMLSTARSAYEDKKGEKLPAFLEDKVRRWVDGEEAALVKREGASSSHPLAPIDALGYEDKEREVARLSRSSRTPRSTGRRAT